VTYQIKELLLADGDSPFGEWFRGIGEYNPKRSEVTWH